MKNREEEEHIELCTREARRGIIWWKIGAWRLKEVGRNSEEGICATRGKKKDWSHILKGEGTKIWKDRI
jgi:hypothetical protein